MKNQLEMGVSSLDPVMNHGLRVAICVRVSIEEQAEQGFAIEAQLQNLRDYCKLYGKEVVAKYVDRGVSGKSIVRR